MSTLAIISYFKNEAHILHEWIRHHLNFGVNHIFLLNNGSQDRALEIIEQYKDNVTVHNVPNRGQQDAINWVYKKIKNKYQWVSVLDLDEFLYIEKEPYNLEEFLKTLPENITSIKVFWKIFLPSANLFQPKSCIDGFTIRIDEDKSSCAPYKSINRCSSNRSVGIHHGVAIKNIKVFKPENRVLQINHYRYQSYEYLFGIKQCRGGGVHKNKYNPKNIINSLNNQYKSELIIDKDLLNLSEKLISELNKMEHIKPKNSLYPNSVWSKVKEINFVPTGELKEDEKALHSKISQLLFGDNN